LIATAIHDVYRDGAEAALRHVERAIEWHAAFEAHRRTLVERRQAVFVTDEQQRLGVEFPEDTMALGARPASSSNHASTSSS
jgi:hypothetical protein